MRKFVPAILCGAVVAVSACTMTPKEATELPSVDIDARLAEAVETSTAANVAISRVEVATVDPVRPGPGEVLPTVAVLPVEMMEQMTIDFNGPAETVAKDLAKELDYKFVGTIGKKPPSPRFVSIHETDEPIYVILREVAYQMDGYGDLVVNPQFGTVEIRYGE